MLVPQADRVCRRRQIRGVSAGWVGLGVAINLGWIVVGVFTPAWGLVPVSVASTLVYAAMLVGLGRLRRGQVLVGLVVAALTVAGFGLCFAIGGVELLGLAAAGLYTFQFAPAAFAALTASDTSGISPATWIMGFSEAVLWFAYGVHINSLALVLGGLGATLMSAIVVTQTRGRSRRVQVVPKAS